ncbi:MAG: HEAT repeat domain-containing protein [Verrucomicrobia bacterium]|nr:HEAT repeat domain-containing protein [Verrucomicrobiota bacterium]
MTAAFQTQQTIPSPARGDAMEDLTKTPKLLWTLRQLKSSDWSKRVRAIETLGELQDSRALGPLREALEDADRYLVRQAAAKALGKLGDPTATAPLVAALDDPESLVRAEAALALGRLADPAALDPLIAQLSSTLGDVQEAATQALVHFGAPAVQKLMAVLHQSSYAMRIKAAKVLGQIGDPHALPALTAALQDSHLEARREVIEALTHFSPVPIEPILGMLADPAAEVRATAARALGRLKDPRALEPHRAALKDPDPEVREAVWKALDFLEWPPANQRQYVLRALAFGEFQEAVAVGGAAVEPMREFYRRGDQEAHRKIAAGLKQIGPAAIEPLVAALSETNQSLLKLILETLAALGWQPAEAAQRIHIALSTGRYDLAVQEGEAALQPLLAKLQSDGDWERQMAAQALGELHDARALEPLCAALRDIAGDVRTAAALALGRLGAPEAIPALQAALADPQLQVRWAAKEALEKLGTPPPS